MLTEAQVEAAVAESGLREDYREAFKVGLINNMWFINEWMHALSTTVVIRWLASGMYSAVGIPYSDHLVFNGLEQFVEKLFTEEQQREIALKAVTELKAMWEDFDRH